MVDFADINNNPEFLAEVALEIQHLERRIQEKPEKIPPSKINESLSRLTNRIHKEEVVLRQRSVPGSQLNLYEYLCDAIERSKPPHLSDRHNSTRDLLAMAVWSLCSRHGIDLNVSRCGDSVELATVLIDRLQLNYDPRNIAGKAITLFGE